MLCIVNNNVNYVFHDDNMDVNKINAGNIENKFSLPLLLNQIIYLYN